MHFVLGPNIFIIFTSENNFDLRKKVQSKQKARRRNWRRMDDAMRAWPSQGRQVKMSGNCGA